MRLQKRAFGTLVLTEECRVNRRHFDVPLMTMRLQKRPVLQSVGSIPVISKHSART
eukprot:COSAG05_NODE_74_length_21769_cov_194.316290_4_plen_56_part_00